jgi:two-component system heavy metal sensor histidine kinase CusS
MRINSLSARLAGMFAIVTLVTLGVVGAMLYVSLASLVRAQDDEALVTIMEAARLRLRSFATPQSVRDNPAQFQNLAASRKNLILMLRTADGETLLEIHPLRQALPAMTPVADGIPITFDAFIDWHLDHGPPSRAGAAWAHLGNDDEKIVIVAALAAGERLALLGTYRERIVEWVCAGAIAAALLSLLVIRGGLKPVQRIADEASAITVNRLQSRLDAKSAPRELQELVTAINGMLDRIEDGFQRMSQFSADVAHDLRTPITNLMGQTQVALNKPRSPEEYQSLLESNVEEFERLARMVENMLFLARADNAQVALRREQFDLRAELPQIAEYFQGMADERGVTIRTNGDLGRVEIATDKVELTVDPSLLRRAVHNLLANAIRYTPPGNSIDLGFKRSGSNVIVSVANPGPGIPPEHLPHIFDRFYRADPARAESASSAGLGLAIVQSIVRLHGGRAEVESRVEGTTIFRLILPTGSG